MKKKTIRLKTWPQGVFQFPCGRLFEPRSIPVSNEVSVAVAAENLGIAVYYIGINDRISDKVLAYESTGTSVSITIPWESGQPYYNGNIGDCATIYASQKTWVMQACTTVAVCRKAFLIFSFDHFF